MKIQFENEDILFFEKEILLHDYNHPNITLHS